MTKVESQNDVATYCKSELAKDQQTILKKLDNNEPEDLTYLKGRHEALLEVLTLLGEEGQSLFMVA